MSKVKYYYDSENLAYRKIKPKKGRKFAVVALFLLASALFGFICLVLLMNTPFFKTPKDKIQAREIVNMKLRYSILNKKIEVIEEALSDVENRDNNIYRVYFNTASIEDEVRKAGFNDKNRYKELEGYNNSDLVIKSARKVDVLSKQLSIQSKSLDEILQLAKAKNLSLAFANFKISSNDFDWTANCLLKTSTFFELLITKSELLYPSNSLYLFLSLKPAFRTSSSIEAVLK